uniref:Uncharacterized protein n=1 Tax=Anguilla anguilla TaxID=7936 RepID=A0A0E9R3A7_ANGAN
MCFLFGEIFLLFLCSCSWNLFYSH